MLRSRLSIHAIQTRPVRSTIMDSKRCVITWRSRWTTAGCDQVLPPSSERVKRMSPVNFADVGEVHDTYNSPREPNASFGRFSPSADTGSGFDVTRIGANH